MAIAYLFKSKEPGVLDYLGNKLFSFPDAEVDFFIPQLVSMYITYHDIAEKLHPYLIHRCRSSVDFSLRCAWLLDAYLSTLNPEYSSSKKQGRASHGIKLRNLILSGELVPKDCNGNRNSHATAVKNGFRKKTIHTHTKVMGPCYYGNLESYLNEVGMKVHVTVEIGIRVAQICKRK